jgi:hypothetical protein
VYEQTLLLEYFRPRNVISKSPLAFYADILRPAEDNAALPIPILGVSGYHIWSGSNQYP